MALKFVPIRKVSMSEGITKSQNKTKVEDILSLQNFVRFTSQPYSVTVEI